MATPMVPSKAVAGWSKNLVQGGAGAVAACAAHFVCVQHVCVRVRVRVRVRAGLPCGLHQVYLPIALAARLCSQPCYIWPLVQGGVVASHECAGCFASVLPRAATC